MTAALKRFKNWNLDLADKRVQAIIAERTLTSQQREAERRAKEAEAKRLEGERIAAERRAAEEKERAAREEAARVEAKRQAKEREAQRISHENSPPSTDDVVALVAKHYDVSEPAARHWLSEMFGIQQAA